jgi:hypothetical protein
MEISLSMKWERSKETKRELFMEGEAPTLMHSPEVWEHPWAHALRCPSLRGTHSYRNLLLPLQHLHIHTYIHTYIHIQLFI